MEIYFQNEKKNFQKILGYFNYLYNMSKRVIRLTESNLKKYIRKVISEQPENERPQHNRRINADIGFGLVRAVKGNDSYKLVKRKDVGQFMGFGVFDTDNFIWVFGPNYDETGTGLNLNTNTIITKYTNPDGDSFYTLDDIDPDNDTEIPEVTIVSNERTLNNMGYSMD